VPPFVHLLWTEQQTREYFTEHPLSENHLDNLIEYSYHTNLLNRLFYEDYERIVKSVFGEKNVSIKPLIWGPQASPQVMQLLLQKYPRYKRFDAQGMTIKAIKQKR
ncbi:MAG: hypothetical protein LBB88_06220, partial [Planctomycetaceae bacterium]|jgi:hypothetical protein|nr:hypothetical protein [Planctomycetaceae bacterium]